MTIKNLPTVLEIANSEIRAHNLFKQQYLNMVKTRNWYHDYFVTLTFKNGYKHDEAQRSLDVMRYLSILDRALLGKDAKKRGRKLFRYGVFELNKSSQPHIHLLIENPGSIKVDESAHEKVILDNWLKLDCSGSRVANKVLRIDKTHEQLEAYLHKSIRVNSSLMADPVLWHLPIDSAQCDALGKTDSY